MLSLLVIKFIKLYQKTLSPDHSWLFKNKFPYGYCRFYPSCSSYSIDAIAKHGLVKGFLLTIARVAKCNPFSSPKVDQIVSK